MEKIWFVHVEDHHRGPFDDKQIQVLLDTGRINSGHLLWKEGMTDWSELGELEEFSSHFQTKGLPKFPFWGQDKKEKKEQTLFSQEQLDSVLTDLKKVEHEAQQGEYKMDAVLDSDGPPPLSSIILGQSRSYFEQTEASVEKTSWAKRIFLTSLYSAFIICLGLAGWRYYRQLGPFARPSEMSAQDFARLQAMARAPLSQGEKFVLASSAQFTKLWAASNLPGESTLYAVITAVPGRVLASRPIEMKGAATYQNHLATFDSFSFHKGGQFYPGYYQVLLTNFAPEMQAMPQSSFKKIKLEKTMLLGAENELKFLPKLAEFNQKLARDKEKYFTDLEQKNDTYLGLIAEMEKSFQENFKKMKKGSDISAFVKMYSTRFGPLVTNMILDDEKITTRLYDQYDTIADQYRDLSKRGKQIGAVVMELIGQMEKVGKISPALRPKLSAKIHNQFWELRGPFFEKSKMLKKRRNEL